MEYKDCVAVDWGNNENGHLRFSSSAALGAVYEEHGWGKWFPDDGDCQQSCDVRYSAYEKGECYKKTNFDWKNIKINFRCCKRTLPLKVSHKC